MEFVSDLSSHLANEPAPITSEENLCVIFVPARILCFLKDINNGRPWVVICPCHSITTTHSLLTQSWNLSYDPDNTPNVLLIESSTKFCHIMVVEEMPGLPENKPESNIIYKVSDRRHHWPTIFKTVASAGIENYLPSVAKEKVKAEWIAKQKSGKDTRTSKCKHV
jgi:hypothetical protein